MSGFNNLFSVEPALPATQTYRMPDAVETWPEILMSKLREQYTDVAQLPIHVEFTKKDDESGSSIGSLKVVSPESGKSLIVPFIIHGFELKPLDIWMDASQKPHPLTPQTFATEFFSTAIGSEEAPPQGGSQAMNNPSTFHNVYPPITGKYAYASAGYQMLDSIADTMKKEDIEVFKSKTNMKKVASTEHADVFEKLSAHVGMATPANGLIDDLIRPGSLFVGASYKKITPDVYELVAGLDGVKEVARSYVGRDNLKKFLIAALGEDSELKTKAVVKNKKMKDNSPFLFDYVKDQGQLVSATCSLKTQDSNDRMITGIAIPNIVGLDGTKRSKKLFVSPFGYAYQGQLSGVVGDIDSSTLEKMNLDSVPAPGATGVFAWAEDGKILATIPVQIKTIVDSREYHVRTEEGEDTVVKSNYSNEFYKEKPNSNNVTAYSNTPPENERVTLESLGFVKLPGKLGYRIPENFIFITLSKKISVPSAIKEYQEKIAAQHLTPNILEVKTYGSDFWVNGCGFNKETLTKEAFEVALMNLGCGTEEVEKLVKHAECKCDMKLHTKKRLKSKEEAEKEEKEKKDKLEKAASLIKTDFVKEAADLATMDADKPTVDALLALNFVNSDNVARFVGYAPIFKQVGDSLAELTIAARLGLGAIDEVTTTTCMHKIVELTQQLESLSVEIEQPVEAAQKSKKK